MPYIPFTEEQKIAANSVDLADFLRLRGEKLEWAGTQARLLRRQRQARQYYYKRIKMVRP